MNNPRGLTLLDILVIVGIVALLIGFLLPALGSSKRTARCTQNSTALRGFHQAMVTYAQSNKSWFPGSLPTGALNLDATLSMRGATLVRLSREDFYGLDYLISPGETDANVVSAALTTAAAGSEAAPAPGGSYALLDYRGSSRQPGEPLSTLGALEWRESLTTTAIIMSDRQLTANPKSPRSIWATKPDQWNGSLLFNDNHVSFELTDKGYAGKYGTNTGDQGTGTLNNLFDMLGGNGQMTVD